MATKNVTVKTKVSQVTPTPASLAYGEQAYSFDSDALFIGDPTSTPVKIAGGADVLKLAGIEAGAQVNTVNSVAGKTGNVTLSSSDVGLGNVTNESKATMFTNPAFTGTVTGVTATMVGLGNVDNTSDANKPVSTAQQTALNLKANLSGATFTGNVTLVTSTPSQDLEAASKGYVDSVATGLNVKDAVKTATSVAGVFADDFDEGSVVSGVTLTAGDRILLKNQTAGEQNGIYVVQATGAPVRADDFDNTPGVEVKSGAMVYVEAGTLAGTQWVLTTTGTITIDSTPLTFAQFGGGQTYSAGTGLTLTGSTFAIDSTVLTTSSTIDVTKFSNATASTFNGSNITSLNASNISSGTLGLAYLHANVVVDGDTLDGGSF